MSLISTAELTACINTLLDVDDVMRPTITNKQRDAITTVITLLQDMRRDLPATPPAATEPAWANHRHAAYFKQLRQMAIDSGVFDYGWNSACVETGQEAFKDAHYYYDSKIKVWATQNTPNGLKVEWIENHNPVLGIYPDGKVVRCHGEFSSVRAYLDRLNTAAEPAQEAGKRYFITEQEHEGIFIQFIHDSYGIEKPIIFVDDKQRGEDELTRLNLSSRNADVQYVIEQDFWGWWVVRDTYSNKALPGKYGYDHEAQAAADELNAWARGGAEE